MSRYPRDEALEADDPFAPPTVVAVCPASGCECPSSGCDIDGCEHDRRDPTRFGDN